MNLRALHEQLRQALSAVWRRGWQPADVVRFVSRHKHASQGAAALVRDAIADELAQYAPATVDPRWHAQLDTLDAQVWWASNRSLVQAWAERDGWRSALVSLQGLIAILGVLPTIEVLSAVPGEYRAGTTEAVPAEVDEKILARIRAMLAKAEATTSEAEAEAFTAGAQERMARYSIDRAMLDATDPDRPRIPGGRRIGIENPYEAPRAVLLSEVAQANRCRCVYSKNLGFSTVVGFEADLAAVETLYTSLLVQAFAALNRAGAAQPGARSRSRSFRQSFLIAYASRIGERLGEITAASTEAATAEPGGGNVLPVLASRELAVENATQGMFPVLSSFSAGNVSDGAGWHSGRSAADLATLEARAAVQ